MIEVYLDNEQLEVAEDVSIGLTVSVASIEDPISASAAYTQSIDVPRTTHNEVVFGHTEQILSPDIFNHAEHTAAVYEDGVELIKGKAYFEGATDTHYKLQIVGNEFDWLERIKDKKLNEIDSDYISQFREYETMTEEQRKAVFFGLLEHGCWWQEIEDETVRREWATYADLVPFVGLTAILRSIFKGYTIDTGSVTELLSRLYVTGQWKMPDNADVLEEDNEFEVSSTGNNLIDVTINGVTETVVGTKITTDNHGNEAAYCDVFDTVENDKNNRIEVTDKSVTAGGESIQHHILAFAPSEDAITAYKMRIRYTTQYVVKDNKTRIFADTVHFGGMPIAKVRFEDGVESIISNGTKGVNEAATFFYNFTPAMPALPDIITPLPESYKKDFYLKVSEPQLYTEIVQILYYRAPYGESVVERYETIADTVTYDNYFRAASRIGGVTEGGGYATSARIGLRTKYGDVVVVDGYYSAYKVPQYSIVYNNNDQEYLFAETLKPCQNVNEFRYTTVILYLFEGQVNTISFDLQLLTPSFAVSTLEPASLAVGFTSSNATELGDTELLVSVGESTLTPKFNGVLPFGYRVSLNDVGGDIQATEALKAIMHLFNLRIYANSDSQTVHILPYSEFYRSDVVDWSDRVDCDKGVEVTTVGDNIGSALKLLYQEGSAPVEYYNARHKAPYLSWATPLLNKLNNGEYELQNGVFVPPMKINATDIFPNSEWDGGLLNVVGSDAQDTLDNFSNEIPRTLVQLIAPTGDPSDYLQYVGSTGLLEQYLQPVFVVTEREEGTTISFADNGGAEGLHKYYDKQVDIWNYGKRITCYCRIEPQEIESLRKADTSVVDFRSRFKLKIDGEDIYCRLESIENYEPQNATHKCTFIFFN